MANRAESIEKQTQKSRNAVIEALKAKGIHVKPIDGPARDDVPLRNLQEWQAVEAALTPAENPAQADKADAPKGSK